MLEDLNDERSYEGGQPKDATLILEEVFLFVGNSGEEAGWYFVRGVYDNNKHRIYPYTF